MLVRPVPRARGYLWRMLLLLIPSLAMLGYGLQCYYAVPPGGTSEANFKILTPPPGGNSKAK